MFVMSTRGSHCQCYFCMGVSLWNVRVRAWVTAFSSAHCQLVFWHVDLLFSRCVCCAVSVHVLYLCANFAVSMAIPCIPPHKLHHRTTKGSCASACNITLSASFDFLIHWSSCWDLLHWQVQEAGQVQQAVCVKPFLNELPSQPGRQTTMWEFSHSAEEACCANSLHDWALPNKHTPVQSPCQTSSCSHSTAPKVCTSVSLGWGIIKRRLFLCEILDAHGEFITHCVRDVLIPSFGSCTVI